MWWKDERHHARHSRLSFKTTVLLSVAVLVGVIVSGGAVYARLGGFGGITGSTINLQKGLVAWYQLDGNTKDSTPYQHNASLVGAPSYVTDRGGRASAALATQTTSQWMDNVNVDIGNEWTISVWSPYPNGGLEETSHWRTLTRGNVGDHQIIVQDGTYTLGAYDNIGGTSFRACSPVFSVNSLSNGWHNFTITLSGGATGTMTFYIDGVERCTISGYGSTSDVRSIGNYWGSGQEWGTIDDVRIYNRTLSANEAQALYKQYNAQIKAASGEKGLVGWWKLDGNGKDATPYGNNLTFVNATTSPDRRSVTNKAYRFTGAATSYAHAAIGAAQKPTSAMSFSLWANKRGLGSNSPRGLMVSSSGSYIDECYNGQVLLSFMLNTGQKLVTGGTCSTTGGGWHHYAGTYDGSVARLYVDGIMLGSLTTSGSISYDANPFSIGRYDGGDYSFNGDIDDVRLYNRALTATEITNQYKSYNAQINIGATAVPTPPVINLSQGLIGHWPFDGNLNDATPYTRNGTNSGATLTTDRQGQTNKAYFFNGTSATVLMPTFTSFPGAGTTNEFTYCAWVKGTNNRSVVRQQNGTDFLVLDWMSGNLNLVSWDGYTSGIASGIPNDNMWHLGCMVWARNTTNGFRSYTDGVLVAQRNSVDVAIPTGAATLYIGSYNNIGEYESGSIDDVRIWNRALTTAEMQALYLVY